MLIVQALHHGRHNQEKDHRSSQKKPGPEIEYRVQPRILLIAGRNDHVIVLHLPVGKCVLYLFALNLRFSRPGLDNGHVPVRLGVISVNPQHLVEGFSRLGIVLMDDIQKRQKQMGLYKSRIRLHNAGQGEHRQIVAPAPGLRQGQVILFHILAHNVQALLLALDLFQIEIRAVVLLLKIHADDPLHQRLRHLAHLIVDKTQKISGIHLVFIQIQAFFQTVYGACQVSSMRPLQSGIIKAVGNQADFFHLIHVHRLFLCLF